MGEIIRGNFGQIKRSEPISPLENKVVKDYFTGQSDFSPNGVVEYLTGVMPRDDVGVLSKVKLHVDPMERSILKVFPEKTKRKISPTIKKGLGDIDHLDLVKMIADSTIENWIDDPNLYLAIIDEARERGLDEIE